MRPGARLWAMVAAAGGVLIVLGSSGPGAAQIPLPTTTAFEPAETTTAPPRTLPPVTSLRPTTTVPSPLEEVTAPIERRVTTTTTEPPTTTLATIAPAAGTPAVADTTPPSRTRPGQGDMPAWPLWLFGAGAGGTVTMMAGQFVRTRPRP